MSEVTVTNIENTQMLHTDEAGSVTLPIYSAEQALTPVYMYMYIQMYIQDLA